MRQKFKSPALVFNCHYNGLSIIQELGRHRIQVFALDNTHSVGTVSRYAKFWRCPDPLNDEKGFVNFLLDKGQNFKFPPVLFPTNDHWAAAIAKHKTQLGQYYIPCVADWPVVELVLKKDYFYTWALKRGYPVPRLYSIDDLLNDAEIFPVIAKPKCRRLSGNNANNSKILCLLDKNRMIVIKNRESFRNILTTDKNLIPYLLFQELVQGMSDRMYTVGIYADRNYDVLEVFTGRKVRGYPPDIGDCIVGQAEEVPEELIVLVKKIVKDLHYQGIAEFEFKKDIQNGKFKLIEINPRSWSWIGITPACDVSLPWIAYMDLTGLSKPTFKQSSVDTGSVKYIKLIEDFRNCLYAYNKIGYPEYKMNFKQWWSNLNAQKKVYAEFCWDDPLVVFYSLAKQIAIPIIIQIYNKLFRRE